MTDPSESMRLWQELLVTAAAAEGLPNPLPLFGADGLGGRETQTAIIGYQHRRGLPESGQFDEATRAALNPPKPSIMESISMFPSIVRLALGLLPGLPDDVGKIAKAVAELVTDANDLNGIEGLRDAARFARILADEADKVANALDPSGAIQPTNQIVGK